MMTYCNAVNFTFVFIYGCVSFCYKFAFTLVPKVREKSDA